MVYIVLNSLLKDRDASSSNLVLKKCVRKKRGIPMSELAIVVAPAAFRREAIRYVVLLEARLKLCYISASRY